MPLRALLVEFAQRMSREGYVVATQGNLSVRAGEAVLITPSAVPYGRLTTELIAELAADGRRLSGPPPSSERAVHLAIYRARPEINAIVHAHPVHVCALAVAGRDLSALLDEVEPVLGGSVRVARYAPSGTLELGDNAVKAMEGRNAVILARHGSVTGGPDLFSAYQRLEVLERAAAVQILAERLG